MIPILLGIVSNFGTCTHQCSLSNFTPVALQVLKYIILLKCIIIIIIHETKHQNCYQRSVLKTSITLPIFY
jgi:hypothetical protein